MLIKCLFLVAGYDTRNRGAAQVGAAIPNQAAHSIRYRRGHENIVFVTGRGKRAIEGNFDTTDEL